MTLAVTLSAAALIFSAATFIISLRILLKPGGKKDGSLREYEDAIEKDLSLHRQEINMRLDSVSGSIGEGLRKGFSEISLSEMQSIQTLGSAVNERLAGFEKSINSNSEQLDRRLELMRRSQEESLEAIRRTTENRLSELKEANQKKLDEIQGTVSEKLDKALTERVSESFRNVSDQLEKVYKGLGEMQSLASDVGSLKNALSNVKVRGEIGEIQLSRILEQTLSAEQYDENVVTVRGSRDAVEFAVKIPSKEADGKFIYLPVDAKFPLDTYSALCEAYDGGVKADIETAKKALFDRVRADAKNIHDKYICVPDTTDFAIMFLPTEGLFAEIIRNAGLTEKLRQEFKVTVCGPSTITAFLNSLQMGFKTLTYEKKSGQIARILSEVKTEFGKFGDSLAKVQKNIDLTGKELDNLVGTRTRAIQKKLRDVEELPEGEDVRTRWDEEW